MSSIYIPKSRTGLSVRGDSLYCPLAFTLDPYWWCEPDCLHCYLRRLNKLWGTEQRGLNLEKLDHRLSMGPLRKKPKTPLANCLANRNTIRVGNKADPFQPIERQQRLATHSLRLLYKYRWSFVIQTRFPGTVLDLASTILEKCVPLNLATVMPVISPGMERDWELFEQKRTEPIKERLRSIKDLIKIGVNVGVNGEPFIPGFHVLGDFEDTLKRLKAIGVSRYNTYNLHFTEFVAKRIHDLPGVDIERIWYENQDKRWRITLTRLIELAKKHNFILGCPDFVNSGPRHLEEANTCCGVDVPRPTTFNTHYFKRLAQKGYVAERIVKSTWDGVGDLDRGRKIIRGAKTDFYTLKDAEVKVKESG